MKQKLKLLLEYEANKYRRKGLIPSIFGIILFITLPIIIKFVVQEIYISVMNFKFINYEIMIIIGLPLFHFIIFMIYNLAYFILYYYNPYFVRKFKCNQNEWPFNDINIWTALKQSSILQLGLNILIINPLLAYFSHTLKPINFEYEINKFPDLFTICIQISFFFFVNDFIFHFSHKMLHTNYFYKAIHYKHHEYKTPISISAEYAHPIEYLIGNIIPASLGPFILFICYYEVHIITLMMWIIIGIGATIEQHSGYEFPFSPFNIIPFTFTTYYHDFHHTRFKGNYSSNLILWDFIFSNNIEYMNHFNKLI